ncbi:hypothetical protein DPPLL_13740 [Desulfofustis limnaeus]|uniref:Transposase IS4-like domain-containing protein n=1 Tax=Desulfofustis limnaeus TaxID=2740163 RepID=A0ABM7W7Y8_9BACT|nr:hypothetical protein DPPLL_13740 [Desulfofustis limnaeus]
MHDVNALDILTLEVGAYYVMDRGYLDFERLNKFNQVPAHFVTRAKSNTQYKRRYSHPIDKSTGLICDQTIVLTGFYARKDYPGALRRVKFRLLVISCGFDIIGSNPHEIARETDER